MYEFVIRLIPPYFYEADAWFRIIRKLEYTKVIVIHSPDEESRMVTDRFQMLTDDSEIQVKIFFSDRICITLLEVQIERMEEYEFNANLTTLISKLTAEDRLLARVFIIHTRFVVRSTTLLIEFLFSLLKEWRCWRNAIGDRSIE